MVKPRLAESQFPTVEKHTHRIVPEAMTLEEVPLFDGHRKFSKVEYPVVNGARKRTGHLHVLNVSQA
jgi:hypothetical protein